MLFKLSKRNVQRSIKDYSIYFFTLALGVCIFYIFNSVEAQTAMMDMSKTQKMLMKNTDMIISSVSVFVSFILGFLIIYANNFIIKKRNREFGIYMTLGISRSKISFMLFYETIIVGVISLAVGLFVGVFLSQGLASVTAKLFSMDMKKYQFVFSKEACIKTIIYFSIMFFITMILNFIVVSRYKLINLINSQRKNEKLKGTNLMLSVVLFIISIVCLGFAYKLILDNGLINITDSSFNLSILLGVIGTILFFRSLAGFLIKLVQNDKKLYLKNLNTFTLRQLNSKINTNYISMSIICLMLLISIGMYSSAIGLKNAMEKSAEFSSPCDMSISEIYTNKNENKPIDKNKKLSEQLNKHGFNVKDYSKEYLDYNFYTSPVSFVKMFENTSDDFLSKQIKVMMDSKIPIIKLSDYNKISEMLGRPKVNLDDKEVMFITNLFTLKNPVNEYIKDNKSIRIGNNDFKIHKEYKYESIENYSINQSLIFVVGDKYTGGYNINRKSLSFTYSGDKEKTEEEVVKKADKAIDEIRKGYKDKGIFINGMSKKIEIEISMSNSAMFLYIGLYIGIIFLISSAAVLALNQLSGATESLGRYEILKKLGVSSKMINRSIFIQVFIYFSLPIVLALVHSYFGIKVANNAIKIFGDYDTVRTNVGAVLSICVIYAIYFFGTYKAYKRIVNKNN
ncbi:ABC transporter permease [Paraclostridium sordellii]|uniref:ABC transporter permease n=1 Tax=Paraclostridium sordellii TaxID=1505 RepID=UPI00038650E3|nr:ABC transporter permease [Paeniclostridium sordellii]EPZ58058.1 ftsX-like permease family protein [[Clostridium] sordellii VPI 9048] [Paeniclostridium sordellii VPI 9048]CEK37378.1 ABC transporter, permease protein [[Clostridium] sordellii] [Paeniclostridium sordellii]